MKTLINREAFILAESTPLYWRMPVQQRLEAVRYLTNQLNKAREVIAMRGGQ